MVITSADNAKIVHVTKLLDKKYRREYLQYVIEGARLVGDAIRHGANVVGVYVAESKAQTYGFEGQIVVADKIFSKMSDTVHSQGVLAVVQREKTPLAPPSGNCLVLDGLQDPGNVGTLIRTAVACGFGDIYAIESVDLYSPKVLRSAMSAHFCIDLHEGTKEEVFDLLQDMPIVVADMAGENVFSARFSTPIALVLGNEGYGVSEYSRNRAKTTVALPMANNFESLNVAVAGSVIMYQVFSQNSK